MATDRGETALADAARRKADLIEPDVAGFHTLHYSSLNSLTINILVYVTALGPLIICA